MQWLDKMDLSPLFVSLRIAFFATLFTFITGVLAAWRVYRLKRGKPFFDGLFTLPMVLPPTVVGFLLLMLFGRYGPLGETLERLGIEVVFTRAGAVIAASVVAFPLMYRSARGAFEQLDPDYINVARTLGMGEWAIFLKVILPNSLPGVLAGTVLSFARSMGEFGATTLLAGNIPGRTQTMALAVYSAVQGNHKDVAMRWSVFIVIVSFAAIFLLNLSLRKHEKARALSKALKEEGLPEEALFPPGEEDGREARSDGA